MNRIVTQDIITSATPLETGLAGVHPRLYASEGDFKRLRRLVRREPYASLLARVRRFADSFPRNLDGRHWQGDLRTSGDLLASLALLWKITRKPDDLARARTLMRTLADRRDWGVDLEFGHLGHGAALAWDWLYHDLPRRERDRLADALVAKGRVFFEIWSDYDHFAAFAYTWNHMAVPLTGLTAMACALYGERPRLARWLKMALEKTRLMAGSLGPDGLSPEGTAYGQYHADYLARTSVLLRDLAGADFLRGSDWWRQYGLASLYLTFPRAHWRNQEVFFMLGDADRRHWLGPDPVLRLCARLFRDGHAQWLAHELHRTGSTTDHSAFLNLLWHDPTVPRVPPRALPPCRHFSDLGLVLMRSGWHGRESVLAFFCGPHSGAHNRTYVQNVSGGHQHPMAGALALHAHGDFLLVESGYPRKRTAYENTLLVNGRGQIGEGGDWFEDLAFRQGQPAPRMRAAGRVGACDYAIGDAANAYPLAARLKHFIRHVYALAPDHWLIVDELEAEQPVRFTLLFHGDRSFQAESDRIFLQLGDRGGLRLHVLEPAHVQARCRSQTLEGLGHPTRNRSLGLLELAPRGKVRKTVFLTHLHAFPSRQGPTASLAIRRQGRRALLLLHGRCVHKAFVMNLARPDPATPVLQPARRTKK
jgi:hypothetical protein